MEIVLDDDVSAPRDPRRPDRALWYSLFTARTWYSHFFWRGKNSCGYVECDSDSGNVIAHIKSHPEIADKTPAVLITAGMDLQRGDIVEFVDDYWCDIRDAHARFIFDGKALIPFNYDEDVHKHQYLPSGFFVFTEFPLLYWDDYILNRIVWVDMARFRDEFIRNLTFGSPSPSAPAIPYTWFCPSGGEPVYVTLRREKECKRPHEGDCPIPTMSTFASMLKYRDCFFEYRDDDNDGDNSDNDDTSEMPGRWLFIGLKDTNAAIILPTDARIKKNHELVKTMGPRRPDRALVHVLSADAIWGGWDDNRDDIFDYLDEFPGCEAEMLAVLTTAEQDLRRGDIVKFVEDEDDDYCFAFDGKSIVNLSYDINEKYGCIPPGFFTFTDFPPRYWKDSIFGSREVWIDMTRFRGELLDNLTVGKVPICEHGPEVPYSWFCPPNGAPVYVVQLKYSRARPRTMSKLVRRLKDPECGFDSCVAGEYDDFPEASDNLLFVW